MQLHRTQRLNWKKLYRPGLFGRRRDAIVADLNAKYGTGKWTLVWGLQDSPIALEFLDACVCFYEESYIAWFLKQENAHELDFICSFGECIDNAPTNIQSGCDYAKQEAFSTHIQDIAIRNVLGLLGRRFEGPKDRILVIRSSDSNGFKYGPGNIPFYSPDSIEQPSKRPKWANTGSIEDFWQSNKYVACLDSEVSA